MNADAYLKAAAATPRPGIAARIPDLLLVAGVVGIIAMMILPLPPLLVDALVAINITFAILLLLTTLYIRTALDFSVFPSILLISTLFRLSLSVATTRMILKDAHAGHIIDAFGSMVAGGNLVVGLVVYLIIVVVQFIVIAKGAERVAEVAARFTLDSMPGKQLSIDSDLRSGLIDKDEARRRRRILEQESKLHGSLDGAMKFVKGDAIASIVIVIVNLIGGLAIGVLQRDMTMGAAMHTYSILSIGEGLVAQIPALLSAMAAGLLVTRTTDETNGNLGQAISGQLSANPRVLLFGGIIALAMAAVPGFPAAVFLGLGAALVGGGAMLHPRLRPYLDRHIAPALPARAPAPAPVALEAAVAEPRAVLPLLLLVRPGPAALAGLPERLTQMLDTLQHRSGVPLPRCAVHFDYGAGDPRWQLLVQESPIGSGSLGDDGTEGLVDALHQCLRRNLALFIGLQEATGILNRVGIDYPEVVKEAVRTVPTTRIAEVLRRLAEEEVPLRALRDILEAIADAGAQEREASRIADRVRIGIRRHIIAAIAPTDQLQAIVVTPELEDQIRGAVRIVDGIERLAFEPEDARRLIAAIAAMPAAAIIASIDVRRPLRLLIAPEHFDLPVLAYNELIPSLRLDIVGQLALPTRELASPSSLAEAAE
ncbi:MAG: type III secretion protein [Alphaproteobacteria bacterium]|nr:MAG: type III secretion protein [Alphaproteobacteria bacterium]